MSEFSPGTRPMELQLKNLMRSVKEFTVVLHLIWALCNYASVMGHRRKCYLLQEMQWDGRHGRRQLRPSSAWEGCLLSPARGEPIPSHFSSRLDLERRLSQPREKGLSQPMVKRIKRLSQHMMPPAESSTSHFWWFVLCLSVHVSVETRCCLQKCRVMVDAYVFMLVNSVVFAECSAEDGRMEVYCWKFVFALCRVMK
uniref:uncharacterized protein LOC105353121 n=1 Tax=Fragaria vesca subsp. vesca TaxID=101020 RepID=UPI0005CA5E17|nr:PREDICTED: uncharacterized protein LOC105353121 [Fragaria vesca subsp. vesca]